MKHKTRRFWFWTWTLSLAVLAFVWASQWHVAPHAASAEPFRFLAFGDMGTGDSNQYALANRMALYHDEHPFDTVLMLGDNIYPDGNPAHLPAKFEKPYAELLRRGVLFYAVLGNHDVRRGREAQINYPLFNMGGHAYRTFTKGDGLVEFFALDSTDFDAAQQTWLTNALAASPARWKIAYFHHPLYSSARTHGSDTNLRAKLEPLFVRYGVAAVFAGHDHVYERTKPQQGIQHFVAGAASGKLRRGNLDRKTPFFATGNDETNSFMAVEVTREQMTFAAIDTDGNLLDSGTILPVANNALPPLAAKIQLPPELQKRSDAAPVSAVGDTTEQPRSRRDMPSIIPPISAEQAREIALRRVPGTIEKSRLRRKDDQLVYDIDVRTQRGTTEIRISATDGQIVRVK